MLNVKSGKAFLSLLLKFTTQFFNDSLSFPTANIYTSELSLILNPELFKGKQTPEPTWHPLKISQ